MAQTEFGDRPLVNATASLATAAPVEWRAFLERFQEYAVSRKDMCVHAPLDAVARAQGQALQCDSLQRLFADAVKTADRIASKAAIKRA